MPSKDSQDMYPGRPGTIAPIANVGDRLVVVHDNAFYLYTVLYREGLPPSAGLIRDFGALVIAASALDVSLQAQLEMPDMEVGQFRAFVLDDIRVTVKQPRSVGRFALKNAQATISLWSRAVDPCDHLTEFYVFEDQWPFADVLNVAGVNLAQTRIAFYGLRYGLEQISRHTAIQNIPAPYQAVVGQGTFGVTH